MADEQKIERASMTLAQIREAIEDQANVDVSDVRRTQNFVWVARYTSMDVSTKLTIRSSSPEWKTITDAQRSAELKAMMEDLTPVIVARGRPWPMNPAYVVADIFADADEVRVYAVPVTAVMETTKKEDSAIVKVPVTATEACMRYTISKSCPLPTYTADVYWAENFVDAICNELEAVDNDDDPEQAGADGEREQTIAYLKTLPELYRTADLVADLTEELHFKVGLPDPDPEEEGEEQEDAPDSAPTPVAAVHAAAAEPKTAPAPANEPATAQV
jgi:hypothetical protein